MQKAIKVSERTYKKLDDLRNKMFPFPVSYARVVEYATEKLEGFYANAKEKIIREEKK
tara:strand:+ start:345 stop:518 length:174 start_codon:yes stop_codon:yes gene_type:complete